MGNQNGEHRPPGVVERRRGVEQADQVGVLRAQIVDQAQQAAAAGFARGHAEPGQEQADHDHRDQQHHAALHSVGQDVGMRPAQHDVNQQYGRRDAQRPDRRQSQQNLEHDQAGHELPGQIETQQQRKHGDQDANALRPIAVAQILRDGAVAEAVPGRGDQPHGDQHAQIDAGRIQERAPDGRQAPFVAQAGRAHERRAARRRRRERERQKQRPVRLARGGEVVGVFHAPLRNDADRQHAADVGDQEQPRPGDERHDVMGGCGQPGRAGKRGNSRSCKPGTSSTRELFSTR